MYFVALLLTNLIFVEENFITRIEYGFHYHDVEIIDTAGQEEFLLFRDSSMVQGDAFLLIFAINSSSSWQHLKELRSKIVAEKDGDETIPMVVVGNKRVTKFFPLILNYDVLLQLIILTQYSKRLFRFVIISHYTLSHIPSIYNI